MSSRVGRSSFRPDIQGLRAIAVLLVLVYHAGVPFLPGGYVGVDVFFVISGFLITSHLLTTLARDGHIRFGDFYARRARRILPASFAVLILTLLAALIWVNPLQLTQVFQGAMWTALYVPNYLFAMQGTDYLAETTPSLFQHYWSLGIEEQFYLLWPAALAIAFIALRRKSGRLWVVVLAIAILSFTACLFLATRAQPWAFFSLPTRAWELAVGGLIASMLVRRPKWSHHRVAGMAAWLGLALVVGSGFALTSSTPFPGVVTLVPVVGAALLIVGGSAESAWSPARILSLRPLVFIGTISYSLYLVHWPLLQIPQSALGYAHPLPLAITVLLGVAAIPLAWLSYRFVEEPFRRGRAVSMMSPRAVLASTLVASLVVVAASGAGMLASERAPLNSGRPFAASAQLTAPPQQPSFVPSNLTPTIRDAEDDNASVYSDGCHQSEMQTDSSGCQYGRDPGAPVLVLFGDSHAASWFPALSVLAEQELIQLDVNSKSRCSSALIPKEDLEKRYPSCVEWRDGVLDRLKKSPPDIVVLANYAAAQAQANSLSPGDWRDALEATVDALPETTKVIVMADNPDLGVTPGMCLSAHLNETSACDVARGVALDESLRAAEQQVEGSSWLDMTSFMCDAEDCPPVIGSTLVYRDAHHLTKTFSEALAPVLRQRLGF